MIKEFMNDVMWGGVKAFFITFGIGIFILILILSMMACKGPVEFVSPSEIWRNPLSPDPLPVEDVCGACGVDHQLLVAAGKDLNECYQTVREG